MSNQLKPTEVVVGPGAGKGATATLVGTCSDSDGVVELTLGTDPPQMAILFSIVFGEPFAEAQRFTVLPYNAPATSALTLIPSVDSTTNQLDVMAIETTASGGPGEVVQFSYSGMPIIA